MGAVFGKVGCSGRAWCFNLNSISDLIVGLVCQMLQVLLVGLFVVVRFDTGPLSRSVICVYRSGGVAPASAGNTPKGTTLICLLLGLWSPLQSFTGSCGVSV